MDYYTGYRLGRFILAMSVWLASVLLTLAFLVPATRPLWEEMQKQTWLEMDFWTNALVVFVLVIGPPLIVAAWALYELISFLDRFNRPGR